MGTFRTTAYGLYLLVQVPVRSTWWQVCRSKSPFRAYGLLLPDYLPDVSKAAQVLIEVRLRTTVKLNGT